MGKRNYVKIKDQDNVVVVVQDTPKGTKIMEDLTVNQDIPQAHKVALKEIPAGGEIIRYGVVLGYAIHDIKKGDWINEHMLELPESPSVDNMEYGTNIVSFDELPLPTRTTWMGYKNDNGPGGAVDYKLISICHKGDIVVSQDYGVAAMALGKGVYAIHQSGKWYTNENIDQMLMERHLNKKARRGSNKNHMKGPGKRIDEDDVRFAQSFEKLIRMAKSKEGVQNGTV